MSIASRTTGILPVSWVGRALLPDILLSFVLSLALSIWMAFAIGRNLGLFFGGLTLAAILAPIIAGKNPLSCLSIFVAISLVWLSCIFNDAITVSEWFGATLV